MSVEEASQLIKDRVQDFGTESISINKCTGRVLREPIIADRDFPPYDRVTMDGIAIRYADFKAGVTKFHIAGVAAAGSPKMTLNQESACLEIMTGAIMADGTDTVIPYEKVTIEDDFAELDTTEVKQGQNVHLKGFDQIPHTSGSESDNKSK